MEGRGAARKFVSKNGEEEEIEKYKIITKKGGAAQSVSSGYGGRSSLPDASRKWRNLVSRRGGTLGELEKGVDGGGKEEGEHKLLRQVEERPLAVQSN